MGGEKSQLREKGDRKKKGDKRSLKNEKKQVENELSCQKKQEEGTKTSSLSVDVCLTQALSFSKDKRI